MVQRATGPCQGSLLYNDKAQADVNIRRQAGYIDQARSGPTDAAGDVRQTTCSKQRATDNVQADNVRQTSCKQQTTCGRHRAVDTRHHEVRNRQEANAQTAADDRQHPRGRACVPRVHAAHAGGASHFGDHGATLQHATRNRQQDATCNTQVDRHIPVITVQETVEFSSACLSYRESTFTNLDRPMVESVSARPHTPARPLTQASPHTPARPHTPASTCARTRTHAFARTHARTCPHNAVQIQKLKAIKVALTLRKLGIDHVKGTIVGNDLVRA